VPRAPGLFVPLRACRQPSPERSNERDTAPQPAADAGTHDARVAIGAEPADNAEALESTFQVPRQQR